jgi:hypothetical protein
MQGTSLAAIARDEGVSRQTIWKQAAADDVRQIVAAVVNGDLERIGELDAQVIRAGKGGELVDLGSDHYARLAAVDRLIRLLTAGLPVAELEARVEGEGRRSGGPANANG